MTQGSEQGAYPLSAGTAIVRAPAARGAVARPSAGNRTVRRDIEGLRAIAVLAVIVNHAVPSALRGGFTGVDIFFVISGYLIGGHLLEDIESDQFSFRRFYSRRARRLFPALITVLVAVWMLGWSLLSGREFAALGKHIAAATIFSNNLLLWSESGYFDAPAATKPLLHLWSLGVEEQFYLLVPLLLWLAAKGRRTSIRWVVWLSVVSLLLMDLPASPSFYLLSSRFWELGAGVALSYLVMHGSILTSTREQMRRGLYRELLIVASILIFTAMLCWASLDQTRVVGKLLQSASISALFLFGAILAQLTVAYQQQPLKQRLAVLWERHETGSRIAIGGCGICLLAVSLGWIDSTDWPGPQALLPVLGTLLLIMAGPKAVPNRLLGCGPLVFFGGISYPLYLWHWPALVFWRSLTMDPSALGYLVPIGVAVLLACLTKEFIECPARFGKLWRWSVPTSPIWAISAGLLCTGVLGWSAVATAGFPNRFSAEISPIANWSVPQEDTPWRVNECYFYPGSRVSFQPECTPPQRAGVPRILLWGDSHAGQLYSGLTSLQRRHRFDIVQWSAAGCPPVRLPLVWEQKGCDGRRAFVVVHLPQVVPDTVILAGAWELYLTLWGSSEPTILAAIRDDVTWLRQIGVRHIVLFGPGPTWDPTLPEELFDYMRLHRTRQIPARLGHISDAVRHLEAAMAAEAAKDGLQYVSLLATFCNATGCRTLGDHHGAQPDLLYRDRDHLTVSGSYLLMSAAETQIFPTPKVADTHR